MDTTPTPVPEQSATPTLSWRSFPFLEKRVQGISVLIFILAVLAGIWFWTYEWYMVALGAIFLFGTLASYFFPTKFTLSDDGVELRRLGRSVRRGWDEFRSFYADKRGLMLSTFDRVSRMDAFRGFNIHFSGNRDAVIAYVEKHLPRL
jgi:hypothetical protein